jgi:transcriptional antiterminator RfaH
MLKSWIVATYKINEAKKVEVNLANQKIDYYLPKITMKKNNSEPRAETLFPGYIFVNANFNNYSAIKYTVGIKDVLKFGDSIACINYEDIEAMKKKQEASKDHPITPQIQTGQDATISSGIFKGSMVQIYSISSNKRIEVLFSFLGAMRHLNVSENDLIL